MNQARSWEEFREACAFNRMPAENMVWVDRTRHHRLAGGRDPAAAAQLERPAAGARRRALRVGRVPAHHGASARGESSARVRGDGQPLPVPERLPVEGGAALHVGRPLARITHRGGAGLGAAVQRGRNGAAAERRSLAARARARAADARPAAERGRRQGPRRADGVGLRARQGLGGRRRLRHVPAAAPRQRPRQGGLHGGPRRGGRRDACPRSG